MTLYDLEQQLCLELSVDEFSQLSLGPLLRNPVVVQYFQPPQALEQIPKVTATILLFFQHPTGVPYACPEPVSLTARLKLQA